MKKIHLTAFLAAAFAVMNSPLVHAQTSFTLDGTSGTNSFTNNYTPGGGLSQVNLSLGFFADYLVVGGGGSGGTPGGAGGENFWGTGGGGGGGMLEGNTQLSSSNYSVSVGAGGIAPTNYSGSTTTQGVNGSNSVFGSVTALGGGGGGAGGRTAGSTGGSGGGGGGDNSSAGGLGTTNQGFAGGASRTSAGNRAAGGGGGGAGGAGARGGGSDGNSSIGGDGGAGNASTITGSSVSYAGGGGGGSRDSNGGATQGGGSGGSGGGGAGSITGAAGNGTNGLGGGGGGRGADGVGGNGGSGVVIVRYQGESLGAIGGTVTEGTGTAAGYTLHTFTNTGSANFDMSGVNLNNRLGATISGNVIAARVNYDGPGALTLAGSNNRAILGGLYANTGTVRITGTMEAGNLFIASPSNSTASVVVEGGVLHGSAISGAGQLISRIEVGQRGNGSLTLDSGFLASLTTYLGYSTRSLGGVTNGSGTATVNGGIWTNWGGLSVGDSGSGTLNVNGGTVVSGRGGVEIGQFTNGHGVVNVAGGTLTVTDPQSGILLSRNNGSGNGGAATLNISNGGTVVTPRVVLYSTNAALNLAAGGTLQIASVGGLNLWTTNSAGFEINGALAITGLGGWVNGPLRVGSGGTNGSLSGNLYSTSTVTFNRSDDLAYSGNLSGTATLIKEGAGTLTLSGSNSFKGDTVVNNGRLLLGSSTALGSGSVVKVNAGGTLEAGTNVVIGYLDLNGGTVIGSNNLVSALTLINSGNIGGLANGTNFNAGILKRTAGVATVISNNTFTGVIRAEAGTIQMTNGGSFAAASSLLLSNTASLDLNGISQEFSSVNGAGSVALGSGTLTVGGSEDSAFSGAISGIGGLVKSGGGVMTLSGTSTYNGATTVSGGELIVDGAANSSTVTVNSGATLSGSGSIGGLIVNTGGTINPGNSPGTQTVEGNAVWNAGGNYNWQIHDVAGTAGSSTGWDLLSITGTLDLSALSVGSEFKINLWSLSQAAPDINGDAVNFDPAQNYTWRIATAAGGITNYAGANQFFVNTGATNGTGGFSNLLDNGTFSVVQSGNDLNLVFTSASAPIPEPGTWAAAVLLAGGGAYLRWRRRRN